MVRGAAAARSIDATAAIADSFGRASVHQTSLMSSWLLVLGGAAWRSWTAVTAAFENPRRKQNRESSPQPTRDGTRPRSSQGRRGRRTLCSSASDCYFGDAPTSREDSTVQVPAAPVVISDAASQKLGTNWSVMNWLRARARIVMSIFSAGTWSRHASG